MGPRTSIRACLMSIWGRSAISFAIWPPCRLHHPEDIAFRVLRIRQPAYAWDGHLGKDDLASLGSYGLDLLIEHGNVDGANVGNDSLAINRALAAHHSAINAWLAVRARFDEPVIHRAIPLHELPGE